MKLKKFALLLLMSAGLAGCVTGQEASVQDQEYRGKLYPQCIETVKSAKNFELKSVHNKVPKNKQELQDLNIYIANIEYLEFAPLCRDKALNANVGNPQQFGNYGMAAKVLHTLATPVPAQFAKEGKFGQVFFEKLMLWGYDPEQIQHMLNSGVFERFFKLIRVYNSADALINPPFKWDTGPAKAE